MLITDCELRFSEFSQTIVKMYTCAMSTYEIRDEGVARESTVYFVHYIHFDGDAEAIGKRSVKRP